MITEITNLGEIGLIKDVQPHTLAQNALTDASNVRFGDGEARRVLGWQEWHSASTEGYYILPYEYADKIYWVVAGSSHVSVRKDGATTLITPGDGIDGTLFPPWNGVVFNGILVMNNGQNVPLYWVDTMPSMLALPEWDSTWTARVIKSYKNMLMAFNLTESGTNYPTKYRWSAFADPGSLPTSWEVSDPTIAAGSAIIDATQSALLDAEPLGDYMVAYTRDSAHVLNFIGGQFTLSERPLLKKQGILTTNCVKEWNRNHFVVSDGDVYVHDGQTPESILKGRMYKRIFPNLNRETYNRSYVVTNWLKEEMWFCFPESGYARPNVAAMWSWRYNTWSVRELSSTAFIANGRLPMDDSPTVTSPVDRQMVAVQDDGGGLTPSAALTPSATLAPSDGSYSVVVMESTFQHSGTDMACTLERTGLQPEPGPSVWMMREVYPLMEGGSAEFYFGSQDSPNDTPTWEGPYTFTPEGTADKINVRVTGRYLAWKATLTDNADCALTGLRFDVVRVGTR